MSGRPPAVTLQLPRPHTGQVRMLEGAARINMGCCGRRFGKTKFGLDLLAARPPFCSVSGYPVAWFAPTYKLLIEVWDEAKTVLGPLIKKTDAQNHSIQLTTGGKLDFWTMDSEDPARGRKYARVVIDEAAQVRGLLDRWNKAIRPTLTDYRGEAWFFSTPRGLNDFHTLFEMAGQRPGYSRWQMPTSVNPYIDPEEIEEARRDLPELVFAQEYLAQFVTFGAGIVKPAMLIPGEPPLNAPVALGVDLAISQKESADYTAIAAISRDPATGAPYIREIERYRCSFHEQLQRIKEAADRWKPVIIGVEDVQYQAAVVDELIRVTSLPVRGIRPKGDKLTRFLPLLTRFEKGLVRYDPARFPAWAREELLAFPEGKHDDGVDALAHAWAALSTGEIYVG